jgi:hypothetical protein
MGQHQWDAHNLLEGIDLDVSHMKNYRCAQQKKGAIHEDHY